MKKLVLTALLLIAALPSMAQTGVFKLSLWDQVALATPPNTQDIRGIDFGIGSKTATVTGVQLDLLARQHLWQMGLDFGHGTGHGVGCCLCVHEGPEVGARGRGEA